MINTNTNTDMRHSCKRCKYYSFCGNGEGKYNVPCDAYAPVDADGEVIGGYRQVDWYKDGGDPGFRQWMGRNEENWRMYFEDYGDGGLRD